ncbi:MAG: sulfotransferase [Cyanobacteria bacterium J06631_6]
MLNTSISLTKSPSLFIVSSGRSGTTLLNSILNASQQIHIPYESDFIARAFPFYQGRQQLNRQDYLKLIDMFMQSSRPRGWGMQEDYLLDYLVESQPQTFAEVDSALNAAYHSQQGTADCLWGIKAPVLIASIDRIMQVYPEAKILHIVRDGRDVCLSYQQVHAQSEVKFGPKSLLANALYWLDGLKRIEEYRSSQIYEFRYEDLLLDPETELRRICQFIGIKYNKSMHQDFDAAQQVSLVNNQHLNNIHRKVKGKLDPKNTQKYLTQMSRIERLIFELIAAPYLAKYHYSLEFKNFPRLLLLPLRKLLYTAARQVNNWRYAKRDRNFYTANS